MEGNEKMSGNNVSWLTKCPASDLNFKLHLKYATIEEIETALTIMTGKGERGNTSRIAACSKELRKRTRQKGKLE